MKSFEWMELLTLLIGTAVGWFLTAVVALFVLHACVHKPTPVQDPDATLEHRSCPVNHR